jgi:3-hydroxyisobutyrate dehydrogenase-like beta-hydroxyacid dehydrogenase
MNDNTLDKQKIRPGFIGLGLMGSRLIRRLHKTGWSVQGWNRSPEPAELLRSEGIAVADSLATLTAASDVILSCLSNDTAVDSVYFDEGGVFSTVRHGTILLEMSTISPELSRRLHQEASKRGAHLMDLAISGSTPAVDAGTITLLAGGDQDTFDRCVPLYESIARQWFLMGPAASGILMKLVVNLLLGVNMQAIAEAISLGEHLQLERNVLLDVLFRTTAIAPAMAGKFQKIKDHDYSPQFPLRLLSKDMDLVDKAAKASGAVLPAAKVTQSILASMLPEAGDMDISAVASFVGHLAAPEDVAMTETRFAPMA